MSNEPIFSVLSGKANTLTVSGGSELWGLDADGTYSRTTPTGNAAWPAAMEAPGKVSPNYSYWLHSNGYYAIFFYNRADTGYSTSPPGGPDGDNKWYITSIDFFTAGGSFNTSYELWRNNSTSTDPPTGGWYLSPQVFGIENPVPPTVSYGS